MKFEHTKPFINGKFIESKTQFPSINPYTKTVLTMIHQAELCHVKSAINSAKDAFVNWSSLGSSTRAQYLNRLADAIMQNCSIIAVSFIYLLYIFLSL